MKTLRKEFIVIAENNNQSRLYEWIDRNRKNLKYISEDEGCGCCVSLIEVEGSKEIIDTFPKDIELL